MCVCVCVCVCVYVPADYNIWFLCRYLLHIHTNANNPTWRVTAKQAFPLQSPPRPFTSLSYLSPRISPLEPYPLPHISLSPQSTFSFALSYPPPVQSLHIARRKQLCIIIATSLSIFISIWQRNGFKRQRGGRRGEKRFLKIERKRGARDRKSVV